MVGNVRVECVAILASKTSYYVLHRLSFVFRPLSNAHDIMQLMGRGGRGPSVWNSSVEIVWNHSDLSHNVPGLYLGSHFRLFDV